MAYTILRSVVYNTLHQYKKTGEKRSKFLNAELERLKAAKDSAELSKVIHDITKAIALATEYLKLEPQIQEAIKNFSDLGGHVGNLLAEENIKHIVETAAHHAFGDISANTTFDRIKQFINNTKAYAPAESDKIDVLTTELEKFRI